MLTERADLAVYECDGFTVEKNRPDVVVFPTSTEEVVAVVKDTAKTGRIGDGKIFLTKIEDAVRIRTNEHGEVALL